MSKRAENGTRTRDPNLGKVVLYQLSYFRLFNPNQRCISPNAVAKVMLFFEPPKLFAIFLQENAKKTSIHAIFVVFEAELAQQFEFSVLMKQG